MLYKFLKEYHRAENNKSIWNIPSINEEIDDLNMITKMWIIYLI